jgi:hypothetical protein
LWIGGEEASQNLIIGDNEEQLFKQNKGNSVVGDSSVMTSSNMNEAENGGDDGGGNDDNGDKSDGTGVYEFNLFTGRLVTEDPEHNMFYTSINPDKCDKNEKGATYDVDLAGKLQGDDTKAEAVVNDPIPPRLFIMNRDGSAVELMKPQDIADFNHLCKLQALKVHTEEPERLVGDARDIPGEQIVHHILLNPPAVSVFSVAFPYCAKLKWHHHPLPVCCRTTPDSFPKAAAHVIAPRISVRRVW